MLLTFFFFVFNKIVSFRHIPFSFCAYLFSICYTKIDMYHFMHFSNTLCISAFFKHFMHFSNTYKCYLYIYLIYISINFFFFFSNFFFLNFFLFVFFFFLIENVYQKTSICFLKCFEHFKKI